MSKKYDVVWSNIAQNDLKKIVEYIADDSPPNAFKIFKHIKQKASNLYTFPERGRIIPELRDQGILQYRELVSLALRIPKSFALNTNLRQNKLVGLAIDKESCRFPSKMRMASQLK